MVVVVVIVEDVVVVAPVAVVLWLLRVFRFLVLAGVVDVVVAVDVVVCSCHGCTFKVWSCCDCCGVEGILVIWGRPCVVVVVVVAMDVCRVFFCGSEYLSGCRGCRCWGFISVNVVVDVVVFACRGCDVVEICYRCSF